MCSKSLGIPFYVTLNNKLAGYPARSSWEPGCSGRWAGHSERGVCLAVFAYGRLCHGRNCCCVGTGCGFCLLTAASIRPGVDMAKGLTPVPEPGGAKKGTEGNKGIMEAWKEAWAAHWTSLATTKPKTPPLLLGAAERKLVGTAPCQGSLLYWTKHAPSTWNWWAQKTKLDKNTTKAPGYCLPTSPAATHLHSLFSRSANCVLAF